MQRRRASVVFSLSRGIAVGKHVERHVRRTAIILPRIPSRLSFTYFAISPLFYPCAYLYLHTSPTYLGISLSASAGDAPNSAITARRAATIMKNARACALRAC